MNNLPLIDYYSRRAAEFEEIYQKTERQAHLAMLTSHVQRLLTGYNVLEVACGTGYWTEVIASVCCSVLASDASEEVLTLAKAKTYENQHIRFVQADAYDLKSIPGGFTAGFAAFWWSHIPKHRLQKFLHTLHGKLELGAHVCFIDNQYVEGSSTPITYKDTQGNTYQHRTLKDGAKHTVLKNFPTQAELKEAVKDFAVEIEVVDFTYYWCLSYRYNKAV